MKRGGRSVTLSTPWWWVERTALRAITLLVRGMLYPSLGGRSTQTTYLQLSDLTYLGKLLSIITCGRRGKAEKLVVLSGSYDKVLMVVVFHNRIAYPCHLPKVF